MSAALRAASTRLDSLIDWFIPAEMAGERETRQRARMFLISHLFGPLIATPIPVFLYLLDSSGGFKVGVLAASIYAFWVFPFVLRAVGNYGLLALLSVQNLIFCILWGCYFYGGATSPFLPWVLTVPLLAFFYLGSAPSYRLLVFGLLTVDLAAFCSLYLSGHVFPVSTLTSVHELGIVSTIGTAVYVSMMALYYAKIHASGVELEAIMKGHLATAAELREATAEAERASAAKAEFLAKMSHELRTPLNAVIGYSQILLEDAADEGDTESVPDLERIHHAGHHLLRLVNEVLDLSKIDAGKMELTPETVNAAAFLRTIADAHTGPAAANSNTLELRICGDLGEWVCDPKKTQQAIGQILDNAVKFTHAGRITVEAERTTRADGPDEIVVSVTDTGIGIDPDTLPGLFEQFTVADDDSATKYGGTGLGLALSLKLCRLMGGDISAESRPGVGSCFTVRLPAEPAPAASGSPFPLETVALAAA